MSNYLIGLCTCPDQKTAERLAQILVQNQAAACVNIIANLWSIYRWQGSIEKENEYLLLIKTDRAHWSMLSELIKKYHPYQVPEIIALSIDEIDPAYRQWLGDNLCPL